MQKIDSVCRLAGAIAHDFNNYLTVIMGYSDVILMSHCHDNVLCEELREIKTNAEHAAYLSHQLLTFSQFHANGECTVNLNTMIMEMNTIFRYMLGMNVELSMTLDDNLWPVFTDMIHIGQVLTNIVLNARDFMKNTGQISISTANVTFDSDNKSKCSSITQGDYVLVSINRYR